MHNLKLFFIDDDPDDLLTVLALSKKIGIRQFLLFDSADTALKVLEAKAACNDLPDVIITDLYMPGFESSELVIRLRSDPRFSGIRIYVLSSSNSDVDRHRCHALGVSGYYRKPWTEASYEELLSTVLQQVQTKRELQF